MDKKNKQEDTKLENPMLYSLIKTHRFHCKMNCCSTISHGAARSPVKQQGRPEGQSGLRVYALSIGLICAKIVDLIPQKRLSNKKIKWPGVRFGRLFPKT